MRYRSILAVLVAAAFLITVVPMTIDGSDAYTMTEGSNSAGYEVKDLSGDDVKMLMPTGWQLLTAKGIIDSILVDHSSNYNITEIVVSDYCYSEYRGEKIEGGDVTTVISTDVSYKISFKATRGSAPASPLLDNAEKNQLILEEMGMDNRSYEGAVFTVSATINNVHSLLNRTTYESNNLGFVLTETLMREAISDYTDSDVTYTYNDGTGEKTINFSASLGEKSSVKVKTTYDFRDEAIEHVSDLSKAVVDRDIREYGVHKWDTVRFGDDELGSKTV